MFGGSSTHLDHNIDTIKSTSDKLMAWVTGKPAAHMDETIDRRRSNVSLTSRGGNGQNGDGTWPPTDGRGCPICGAIDGGGHGGGCPNSGRYDENGNLRKT